MTLWMLRPVGRSVGTEGSFGGPSVGSFCVAAHGGQLGRFGRAGGAAFVIRVLTALQGSDSC